MAIPKKSILATTDLSARNDRVIDRAVTLAQEWKAILSIIHVAPVEAMDKASSNGDFEELVDSTLPEYAKNVNIVIETGSAAKMIAKTAGKIGASLIVTGVARYKSLGDYVLGTTVDHIVRHADIPVLVVKQRPRKPYASILIATDFSDCSRSALLKAADLFPDAKLYLIHAYHVPYETLLSSDGVLDEIGKEVDEDFDAFVSNPAITEMLRKRIVPIIKYGETGTVIADALRDIKVDLMVLGTHGINGFKHAMMGSNAASLLAWVPPDTLMVRDCGK